MDLSGAALTSATIPVPPFALAGGWWIFLIVVIVLFFAVVFGYYTVGGSGINLRPYRRPGESGESPPQIAHDITADVRNWQRGTESSSRRYRPSATYTALDPELAEALQEWRGSDRLPSLDPPIGAADHVRGPEGAQTVTLYLDLTTDPCRGAISLVDAFSQERSLRMAIRQLPLADVHALALTAAEALEAAAAQGRFFEALDVLARAGFSDEAELLEHVAQSVPDPERLRTEVKDGHFRPTIVEHIRQATASGVRAVPEVFIDAEHYSGPLTREAFRAALEGREWRPGSRAPKVDS